jgi:hypothetical protein
VAVEITVQNATPYEIDGFTIPIEFLVGNYTRSVTSEMHLQITDGELCIRQRRERAADGYSLTFSTANHVYELRREGAYAAMSGGDTGEKAEAVNKLLNQKRQRLRAGPRRRDDLERFAEAYRAARRDGWSKTDALAEALPNYDLRTAQRRRERAVKNGLST